MKLTSSKKKKHILTFFQSKPKKFKFYYKPRLFHTVNQKNYFIVNFGEFGLINLKSIYLKIEPILACIKLIKRFFKLLLLNHTNLFILIFPDFYLTSKPREVRMGRGKGLPSYKVVLLKKNTIIFLLKYINKFYAYYILKQCKNRLPVKTKISYKIW